MSTSERPPECGKIVVFPANRHARASLRGGCACIAARCSNVIPLMSRLAAIWTICDHQPDGILPRFLQLPTTGVATPRASATSGAPPNAMISRSTVMPPEIFTFCEDVNIHQMAIADALVAQHDATMANRYAALGKRLAHLREALGISQAELCRRIKCSTNRWNQYESGARQITLPIANKLADEFGATLDWIYRGERRTLPQELHVKLARAA